MKILLSTHFELDFLFCVKKKTLKKKENKHLHFYYITLTALNMRLRKPVAFVTVISEFISYPSLTII